MTTPADWADSARRLLDVLRPPAGAPAGDTGEGRSAHGPDCRWCPVCQAAAVLRGDRPEVTAALADVLNTTAAVLRDLAGEAGRPTGPSPAADPQETDDETGPGDGAVQRIDIA